MARAVPGSFVLLPYGLIQLCLKTTHPEELAAKTEAIFFLDMAPVI
jgi:hypothetical protein